MQTYSDNEITQTVKKTLTIIFFLFLILFIKYRPFEYIQIADDTAIHKLFSLYFFIINQTLGMVHEAGHGVCYILPCPEFLMVLNGTLFQILFPLLIGYYYKYKGNSFGYLSGIFFTGLSLHYTAWYISTAHLGAYVSASQSFLGVDGYHDFNYILSHIHLLKYNIFISKFTHFIAYILMIYVILKMFFLSFIITKK